MLQAAFAEIGESPPHKLREIALNAEANMRFARAWGEASLERSAGAIRERAERRLAWFRRQGARA